jgi:hypothetical protein
MDLNSKFIFEHKFDQKSLIEDTTNLPEITMATSKYLTLLINFIFH